MQLQNYKERDKSVVLNYADVHFHALLKLFDLRCDEDLIKFERGVTAMDIVMSGFKDDKFFSNIMILDNQRQSMIEEDQLTIEQINKWYFDEKAMLLTALIKRANKEKPRIREFVTQSELVKELARKTMTGTGQNIFITGKPGSGKSHSSLAIAYHYCKITGVKFSTKNVVFTPEEFIRIYNNPELTPEGSFLIFDDAGLTYSNRDWNKEENKLFSKLLQIIRHRQIMVIFTAPDLSFIDLTGRKLLHWWMETDKLDKQSGICFLSPKTVEVQQSTGNIFYPYPVFDHCQMSELRITRLPKSVIDEYEEMAKNFKDQIARETEINLVVNKDAIQATPLLNEYCTYRETLKKGEARDKVGISQMTAAKYEKIYRKLKNSQISVERLSKTS